MLRFLSPFLMALELWNDDISALDYLQSLPDGDRSRTAAFGVSGGALQAVLLATIDRRVSSVAPVVMISASFDGDDADEAACASCRSPAIATIPKRSPRRGAPRCATSTPIIRGRPTR
jgi:dienelactone hydrolase